MKLELDIDKFVSYPFTFQQILLLHCIRYNLKEQVIAFRKTDKFDFIKIRDLVQQGYLKSLNKNEPIPTLFKDLAITQKGIDLLTELGSTANEVSNNESLSFVEELKEVYPKKAGSRVGLQANSKAWSKKYESIIKGDVNKHNLIIDCIKLMKRDHIQSSSEAFYPMLATYINQERWEVYEAEVKALHAKGERVRDIVEKGAYSGYGTNEF